jgi:hypothetical protein
MTLRASIIVDAYLVKRRCHVLSTHKMFDPFFKNRKCEDEQAKQKCFVDSGINQRPGLLPRCPYSYMKTTLAITMALTRAAP